MFIQILQLILVFAVFLPTKWLCHKITEEWGLPEWLNYMPYSCRKCLSFWSLMALYISSGLLCHLWITMAVGGILTILDTIAVIVDQKKKTIKVDDEDDWICYKFDEKGDIIYKKPLLNPNKFDVDINGDIITVTPNKQ